MARSRLVAGNWKMHGSRASIAALLDALLKENPRSGCAVCAPFPYLAQVAERLRGSAIAWGAQNVSEHAQGAYTGEVSAPMLAEFGCRYVIVGHSERRQHFGELDAAVGLKARAALKAGLSPIVCLGETERERDAGETFGRIDAQLAGALEGIAAADATRVVIAYEPVWAIGTGQTATPDDAQEMCAAVRAELADLLGASGEFRVAGEAEDGLDAIELVSDDSSAAPNAGSASASRLTTVAGEAVRQACSLARARPERPAVVTHQYRPPATTPLDPETTAGRPNFSYGYAAQAVEVERLPGRALETIVGLIASVRARAERIRCERVSAAKASLGVCRALRDRLALAVLRRVERIRWQRRS